MTAALVFGGLLASAASPAAAQTGGLAPFTAYGTGDALVMNLVPLSGAQLLDLRIAASGGSVNTNAGGLTPITNEFGQNVGPARADRNAYGRGTAIEEGVLTQTPQTVDLNQVILTGLAQAYAAPPSPLVVEDIVVPVSDILYADNLRGEAQATYDPRICPVGRPLTFGRGFVEDLELLGTGRAPDNTLINPVVGTRATTGNPRATTQSRTVTYLASNGDGTFGVVSETRQTVAPISLLPAGGVLGGLVSLEIEVAGEFGFRVHATGKPGGASVTTLGNPLITITGSVAGTPVNVSVRFNDVVGAGGLSVPIPGLLELTLATPARALNGATGTPVLTTADGTSASGAVDLLKLKLLNGAAIDLGVAHMEGAVTVPAGGLKCTLPVSKVASIDPVSAGQDFTFAINIPSDATRFGTLFNCDLVGISAVDTVTTESGSPRIQLLSASNGGVISGNTVTWPSLGNYVLGQPPLTLTIDARVPANSGAGVLRDTVEVLASLGNCRGTAVDGSDIIQGNAQITGIARLDGSAITGAVTLIGPNVTRGSLAATGGNSWPLVAGGGFLLAALGLVRLRRRAAEVPAVRT